MRWDGCEAHGAGHMSIWSSRATKQTPVLAATRRDGAIWAHFFVGNPCTSNILLRAPGTASHLASVAHVPRVEIGSGSLRGVSPHFATTLRYYRAMDVPASSLQIRTGDQRLESALPRRPHLPTIAESGLSGYEANNWWANVAKVVNIRNQ